MVITALPWLLIVAPGSRMKVAVPEIVGVPVILRVPEMKYTQLDAEARQPVFPPGDRFKVPLLVMWRPSFVHAVLDEPAV